LWSLAADGSATRSSLPGNSPSRRLPRRHSPRLRRPHPSRLLPWSRLNPRSSPRSLSPPPGPHRALQPRLRAARSHPQPSKPSRPQPQKSSSPTLAAESSAPLITKRETPRGGNANSGVLTWTGKLDSHTVVTIEGKSANQGEITGALPGIPVSIELEPAGVGVAEAPSPSNGWKKLSLRCKKGKFDKVTIRWHAL
jgi:hypothetical protein